MRSFKILIGLIFLTIVTISCDPEEIPLSSNLDNENITAETGDQGGGESADRHGNTHD